MATDTLPAFPIYELKDAVPAERFNVIASNVAWKLGSVLHSATKSSKGLQAQTLIDFLTSYLSDVARHKLAQTSAESNTSRVETLSESERAIRKSTLHLVGSLATHQPALPASLLVDLAVAYFPSNTGTLRAIFRNVLSDPARAAEFTSTVIPALSSALLPKHPDTTELREVAHTLLCVINCGDEVVNLFAQEPSFIKNLGGCYQVTLPHLASLLGGIRPTGPRATFERVWLETKLDLLDSYSTLLHSLLLKSPDHAMETASLMLEVPNKLSPESSTPFLDMSLSDDLNRVEDLAAMLKGAVPAEDARLALLASQLRPITSKRDIGILAFLPPPAKLTAIPAAVPRTDKGKGKETIDPEPAPDPILDSLVTQVLDILPDQDPHAIRAALQLPRFGRSTEALIDALLSGESLDALAPEPTPAPVPVQPKVSILPERRNVFDDEEMDVSRMRIGKKRSENADTVLRDKAFIAAQKADILRRAAEVSDPDSEWNSDEERQKVPALGFFDEDDDEYGGGGGVNDGEASSESDSGKEDADEGETALELAWLSDPKLFERDADTRRSQARTDLKAKTRLTDEQIEGWKYMLERDPRRQSKIREKHEFKGNQPILPPAPQFDAPRGHRGRGGPRGRGGGRGGGGRGGGGGGGEGSSSGGGGGGDSTRDRANKDKNKAHRANHDRKRGHDKKMARGGFAG